jgi:2-polyprenyl-3-methyl-5-hydroxy-6-metoxy-1,4-benzoquinol methylase
MSKLLSVEERENLTSSPALQNEAHESGAYEYLNTIHLSPRYGVIAAYLHQMNAFSVIDIGCGVGNLRRYVSPLINYTGVDVSFCAIGDAKRRFLNMMNTSFHTADMRARATLRASGKLMTLRSIPPSELRLE